MKTSEPPRLATWILEHLTTSGHPLALSGDLCEQFRSGRTAGWYWRQTFAACVVTWTESFRGRASVLVFALLWAMLAPAWNAMCGAIQSDRFESRLSSIAGPLWIIPALVLWVVLHSFFLWAGQCLFGLIQRALGGSMDFVRFKRALVLAPAIFVPVYGAFFLAVSLYWFSFFKQSQLAPSVLGQIGDLRPLANVIRIPYLLALVGSLWRPVACFDAGKRRVPFSANRQTQSPLIRSVDLEAMSGFVGFFVAAGLLNAAIVALVLCRLPASHAPSLPAILVRATIYVVLGTAAGTAGAYLYWRASASPYRANPPIPFHLFALICAAGWIWVPAAILLSAQESTAAAILGGLLGAVTASGLRKAIPAESTARLEPHAGTSPLFAHVLIETPAEIHGYVIATCVYLGFYAQRNHSKLTSAALLAVGAFLFLWNRTQSPASITRLQLERRATWRLARTAVPAILVTAWALMLGVAHRTEMAAVGAELADSVEASREHSSKSLDPTLTPGGFHSIILWPLPPKKQIIPPIPRPQNLLGADHSRPLVIRFDGNYWYFQPPEQRPGRSAHQARGTPLSFDIRSNNDFPLLMEAHQRLMGPVRIDRCREIDVEIQNKDNVPGGFYVALLLGDSGYPGQPTLSLGQQPVLSSQPGYFRFKLAPTIETLRFALPLDARKRKFDEITVMVIPDHEHALTGPKVAVDQFELLPR